jgi:hypothetical protein
LFRRLLLTRLLELHAAGKLHFDGKSSSLNDQRIFVRRTVLLRKKRLVVYANPPFAGPQAVLAYLSRYTHRRALEPPAG